ncbi:hypothetical protein V8G54_029361 [Vigna mungo]|uniref:Uncharacterized protein n=1 Tax=Vigna mungo TaxID=3915 RepID=A0AAQ3RMJ2_VIGMU
MGIPWEIAKLGVRQGMWGAVKKFDPGLRTYEKQRTSGVPLSPCARAANINTKISMDYLSSLENTTTDLLETENEDSSDKPVGRNIPKLLIVGLRKWEGGCDILCFLLSEMVGQFPLAVELEIEMLLLALELLLSIVDLVGSHG